MTRPKKVEVKWDGRGGVLVEARKSAVRVFVQETSEGGLYIEIAMERGDTITTAKTARESTSAITMVRPVSE